MKRTLYICIIAALTACLWACNDSDDFSTDPSLSIDFSSDTVRFETVFTTIGSVTKQFKVYNRNDKSLRIESIELMNPSKSGFRMNIDGISGSEISDVSLLKKDSLYGFVEITVDPLNKNNPVVIRDSIRFITNGNIQYLQLEAIGQDVYIWKEKRIAADTLLTGEKPFLIYDSLVVDDGAKLTLDKGVNIYFHNSASLAIHGTLEAKGTISEPIVMRGDRFENVEGDVPYSNVPGQWNGITVFGKSYNNYLENVFIYNTINGIIFKDSDSQYKKASLINTIIHNASGNGISAINCDIDAKNCLFTNTKATVVKLVGGKYSFLHCTMANYYRWAVRSSSVLVLSNTEDDSDMIYPLTKCDITNSIIYGSLTNELQLLKTDGSILNYQFTNCLIKNTLIDDAAFMNIIWNETPLFKDVNNNGTYSYDYQLTEESPAIGKANKAAAQQAPFDLKGNSRLSDGNPDIGCYEWIEE